ncbi:hypothetical protein CAI21_03785 [Alkalilimnicola ehrlichii]|uniref:Uncharacterized protein n=1 Tax=Alkalilimnicola ehrlichii TaxID=351052 RepID=A0A3E0WYX7_9GAMM|nr:hypothetical protein [Alkalilimnicola ehrlichii]RFA30649.1 hypothetical protein CAI21_03785 [Alkalilimnicola ehrlichii]RFA38228.1 hypothetical protein CAL65_05145 [Alkalilimnicola ehrlichii]
MQTASPAVAPFWQRLPQFFAYPFKPAAFIVVATLTALFLVLPVSLLGVLVTLALFAFFTKYLFEVLDRCGEGYLDPPPLNRETLLEGYGIAFKQLALFILVGLLFKA